MIKNRVEEAKKSFEEALEKLDDLKESVLISEKEYLNRLRDLYIKYFKDREKYIDEFKKYEQKYRTYLKFYNIKSIFSRIPFH